MTPQQATLVERLYHEASSVPTADRDAWLASACGGDDLVRREVESLLAQDASMTNALDEGALAQAVGQLRENLTGTQLGGYTFLELIDEGGMGQVYRARDVALPRDVAVKVITPEFADDPVRRARFRREASILAALAHPHIAHVYAFVEAEDRSLLAMELVSGETLAATIRRGPLPLADVVRFGAEIADALAEAHAAGIVHRDLKPGNVMVTSRGVKVLDFGLARQETTATRTVTATAIMGTPAYMAPEQTLGKPADARADLFALGLVLYEMAAGQLPMPGAPLGSMLAANPAAVPVRLSKVRREITPELDALVSRLLSADTAARPATAAEVRDTLRALAAPAQSRGPRPALLAVAAAAVLALAAAGWWRFGTVQEETLEVVGVQRIQQSPGDKSFPAFSPDGSKIAFSWRGEANDRPGIYVASTSGGEATRLTESASYDYAADWSPDGSQIAFFRVELDRAHPLMVVPSGGGMARTLRAPVVGSMFRPDVSWMPDGRALVMAMIDPDTQRSSLYHVPLDGSPARRILKGTSDAIGESAISRDGRWLAYVADQEVRVQALGVDGAPKEPVIAVMREHGIAGLSWHPDGSRLLFARRITGGIMSWSRATRSLQTVYSVPSALTGLTADWSRQDSPRVVYAASAGQSQLRTLDLEDGGRKAGPSKELLRLAAAGSYSSDGRWIVFSRATTGVDLWLADASGQRARRLTNLQASAMGEPLWSRDGRHIAFHALRGNIVEIYILDVDPAALETPDDAPLNLPARQLVKTDYSMVSPQWSADGTHLYVLRPEISRLVRVPQAGGEIEDLFETNGARINRAGDRIYYPKPGQRNMFSRSLVGDVRTNPEELVLTDAFDRAGFDVTPHGIVYVGVGGGAFWIRFFDFETKRSHTLAPGPSVYLFPTIRVSPDGRRVLYDTLLDDASGLTLMQLRQAD
jgi:Tol biopolymer transport system component